jgi:hypothetical protein
MLTMVALALGLMMVPPPVAAPAGTTVPPRLEQNKPVPSCVPGTGSSLFSTLHQAKATERDVPSPSGVSDAEARRAIQRLSSPKTALREDGLRMLRTFTTPEGQWAIYHASRGADAPITMQVLEHLASLGPSGQAGLTWIAIHDRDAAVRNEAAQRIEQPPSNDSLAVLEGALRSPNHMVVNQAGLLAGQINAIKVIPLLIAAQFAQDPVQDQADLAWIAIGTQRSYVANLVPITGNSSAGFQPVIGQIYEGVVMAIDDAAAVATTYRPGVHQSLMALATLDSGQSTAHLGWDLNAWVAWYNDTYLPILAARAAESNPSREPR